MSSLGSLLSPGPSHNRNLPPSSWALGSWGSGGGMGEGGRNGGGAFPCPSPVLLPASLAAHNLQPPPAPCWVTPQLLLGSRPSKQDQGQHRWSHRVTARPKYKKTATAPIKPKRPQSSPPTVLFPFTARLPGESSPGPFRAQPLRARQWSLATYELPKANKLEFR